MNYFDSYLGQWASLTYDDVFLNQELQAGRLDETLAYVLRAKTELKFYRQLYQGDTGVRAKLLSQAQAQLDIQEKKIVEVFVKWFENHEVIGDKEASVSPEVIVVLGANEPTLTKRIVAATLIIKQHPSAVVVLSGGGFNPNKTESTQMKAVLLNYSLPNQILVEDDSMDTLGNAIFTKLLLLGKGLLSKSKNILVITSRFHALRAEHYFEIIFNRRNQGISGNEPKIGKNPKAV